MDYYKRYMGDYGRDTSRLSMMEHGAYNLLLDDYYSTRKPLPADLDELCRICRATTKPERTAVGVVANRFFPVGEDGLRHNGRADEEIAKWELMAAENRERGKLGGRPRKNPNGSSNGNQSGYEVKTKTVSKSKPASEPAENPLQIQKEEIRNKTPESASRGGDFEAPEVDPEAYLVWTSGLAYLGGDSKRSLLGGLVKKYGRPAVATKLGELMRMSERPQDPASYLIAAMRKTERGFVC